MTMRDDYPFGPDRGRRTRPWFGPKRFGLGYGPRTWQGYLLVLLSLVPLAVIAAIAGGHSSIMVFGVIPPVIVAVIARVQGRR